MHLCFEKMQCRIKVARGPGKMKNAGPYVTYCMSIVNGMSPFDFNSFSFHMKLCIIYIYNVDYMCALLVASRL